jgi:hypothetical protein
VIAGGFRCPTCARAYQLGGHILIDPARLAERLCDRCYPGPATPPAAPRLPFRVRALTCWWPGRGWFCDPLIGAAALIAGEWAGIVFVLSHAVAVRGAILVDGQLVDGHPWRVVDLAEELGLHLVIGVRA